MTPAINVELAQITIADGDLQGSLARTLAVIETAAADTDLLVLPESCLGGFPNKTNVTRLAEPLNGPSLTAVCNAAKAKGISVALGFTEEDNGRCKASYCITAKPIFGRAKWVLSKQAIVW